MVLIQQADTVVAIHAAHLFTVKALAHQAAEFLLPHGKIADIFFPPYFESLVQRRCSHTGFFTFVTADIDKRRDVVFGFLFVTFL